MLRHAVTARLVALALLAILLVACGRAALGTTPPGTAGGTTDVSPGPTLPASPAASTRVLRYVAFGDSWPAGGHCGGCRTFADLWIPGLEAATGSTIEFTNFMGSHEPGVSGGGDSATLLSAVTTDADVRAAISTADIVLISTGGNELDTIAGALLGGTCGGSDGADCIRALGKTWATNFDRILSEIDSLRDGRPTVVRLVTSANPFVSDPLMTAGLPEGFANGNGALIFQLLADAMCSAATKHHVTCVDVRPILNGASMTTAVDENSAESFRKVADALIASGVPELQ